MNYPIRFIDGEPRFDTLGVIKLCCDHSVPVDDRIYAQAQLGHTSDCLFARILSFETKPANEAILSVVLCHNGKELQLSVFADGSASARCGETILTDAMTSYIIQGEDLQGEYWGAVMLFSLDRLLTVFGVDSSAMPLELSGNVLREHPALSCATPANESVAFTLM